MKKNYLLFIFCFITYLANAQAPFITTWNITNSGNPNIYVPIVEDDDVPDNYTIDFGDGTILTNQFGEAFHNYDEPGIYTIIISGEFSRINIFYQSSSKPLTIEQWGDIQWTSMERAFSNCANLTINATDVPDLTQVTIMSRMFEGCYSLNQPLNNWDVSNVTNMSYMFEDCKSFNQPLNNWDVSNVTDMSYMFSINMGSNPFNQPLNDWDVSNVTNMSHMFEGRRSFNQPLDNWDVSNVTDMSYMFDSAISFNQPIDNWDVSSVTTMRNMFSNANHFNQPLDNWDVSNVTTMRSMFSSLCLFNKSLNNWNVSNVTDMSDMFYYNISFNQPLNNWDVSSVIYMGGMFGFAYSFNQDISNWNFNSNVSLTSTTTSFIYSSGLSIGNYDALLNKFVQLGLENKFLWSKDLQYCDVETRNYLINNLGWTINEDSLAEDCTAVTESFTKEQVSIYPNPVNNILHIETKSGIQPEEVKIYNLQGRQLMSLNEDFENINTESLSSGIYLLSIQTNKGSTEYKLIKN